MSEPIVRARGLSKEYPAAVTAVEGVDFDILDGECFGFLGPNGAGKTTTMQMISCKVRRTGGELLVMGLDPGLHEREIKRRLGVVPQETNLDELLSVEENLIAHARYFDLPLPEARLRAAELLEFVQLRHRIHWNVRNLSGGMKRRLLVARGLINRPALLILDEPTTGLDPQARHLVWEKLRALKRQGVTLIITTHYMEEAAQLCDRLVIMHQAKVLVEGSPKRLVDEHVAPAVVEIGMGSPEALARLAAAVADDVSEYELAGDRLILHGEDGETVLKAVDDTGIDYDTVTFRPASLEDVFLKLAGRALEE